jgi:hypothetical protein
VEDYTGRGLDDLRNKIARTPLVPLQTFDDDPLRVIRCIRFASRFDLTIEPNVEEAIRNPEIRNALSSKVSKERIGIEVTKMLTKTPYSALSLLSRLSLHSAVFTSVEDPGRDQVQPYCDILQHLSRYHPIHPHHWFAAAVSPFDGLTVQGKRAVPAVAHVISDGLKVSDCLCCLMTARQRCARRRYPSLRSDKDHRLHSDATINNRCYVTAFLCPTMGAIHSVGYRVCHSRCLVGIMGSQRRRDR